MLAAAVSSIWRAAAPISRMGCRKWRRLREPSVFCPPYVASSPRAWAILTRDQSASSSSATAIGSAVRTPWPISDRCATMVTRPVSSMDTNAVGLKRGTSTAGAAGGLLANPRGLDALADRCSADPLDGRDLLAFRSRDRRDARARRRTIQVHRARAAEGHATPELGAGESELVAQRPEQWRVRRHVHRHCFAIDVESGHTGFTPPTDR